ncbi:MAG TPA: hypothetical protein VGH16_00935 [Candidatus Binatia bacterium]|jgi:hypothetical protein
MKVRETALAVVAAALLAFVSGCAVEADYPGYAGYDAYYYYPDYEVYYYPRSHQYWWRDGNNWRNGDRPPARFNLHDRDRVRIDMDHPPHTDHARVREMFPSHNANQTAGRGDAGTQRGDSGGQRGDSGAARGGGGDRSSGGGSGGGDRGGGGGGNDSGGRR